MNHLDIPPWLGHLRRDKRGLPVPIINRWGAENLDNFTVEFDPNVRTRAVFNHDEHETVPDYKRQNPQRQRECATQGLCQVCGRPVPWKRRYLVIGQLSVETVSLDGEMCAVVTEPWLDLRCAEFALDHCPALIRRTRDEQLVLVSITSADQVGVVLSTGWVDGALAEETKRNPVAMWAKLALRDLDRVLA